MRDFGLETAETGEVINAFKMVTFTEDNLKMVS